MDIRYFHEELSKLKELGAEFAKTYPALAPMLSGPAADPDVERLLEGVAFQTALLRQKLDDDFPEIIHDLMQLVMPHYLRPIPAATIIAFTPSPSLRQSLAIPAGTQLASVPIDGVSCRFSTTCDVEIHPLILQDAVYSVPSGRDPAIELFFELQGSPLSQWQPGSLRLFLAGDQASAMDLYRLLNRQVKRIIITPADGGTAVVLPAECLKPAGFSDQEALFPYPAHAFPGFRLLQEYFTFPSKFLFFDLGGWERWLNRGRGTRFTVTLELTGISSESPRITRESFSLFAVPAVNIFSHDADPITFDNRLNHYLVRPSGDNPAHYRIFSVDSVTGFMRGTARQRSYTPFELFRCGGETAPSYHTSLHSSPIRQGYDVYLSVAYPAGSIPPQNEILSANLTCTNGSLAESLRLGDVCRPAADSPANVSFRNISHVTPEILPPLNPGLPWRLTSHLALNYLSLANAGNLRSILELYVFPENRQSPVVTANIKRIHGIREVTERTCDRLVGGVIMRGREVRIALRQDHFSGLGDMYLFGCVLDCFLGIFASINTFTRLTMYEVLKGETFQWPARLGHKPLL
jgi:type VI secretion system protein ImpG